MPRKLNQATLDLIREFEGERLTVYLDVAGKPTVGTGHLVLPKDRLKVGDKITKSRSEELLREDLHKAQFDVDRLITTRLNDNQYGAIVSFTFNLGPGALSRSILRKRVNERRFNEAAAEFKNWNKARQNGKLVVVRGLTRRREAERKLFLQ